MCLEQPVLSAYPVTSNKDLKKMKNKQNCKSRPRIPNTLGSMKRARTLISRLIGW
jgi:hypothetical protein